MNNAPIDPAPVAVGASEPATLAAVAKTKFLLGTV